MGDLNCDGLKQECIKHKTLHQFLDEMNLNQLLEHPTRINESSQNLLNVILVSLVSIIRRISDNLFLYAKLKLRSTKLRNNATNHR